MDLLTILGLREDKELQRSWGEVQKSFDGLVDGVERVKELLVELHKLNNPDIEKLLHHYGVTFT